MDRGWSDLGIGAGVCARMGRRGLLVAILALVWHASLAQSSVPIITTVAGGGNPTGNGDGGLAIHARLNGVQQVAVDGSGNLYLAETYGARVRKVNAAGVISTFAGNGNQPFNGDNILATNAAVDVRGVATDNVGNVFISDGTNGRIRKVAQSGIISSIATGVGFPTAIAVAPNGVVHFVDGSTIRKVTAAGTVQPVAGTGEYGFHGDNGPALSARLASPSGIAFDPSGNLYIVDGIERIRKVSPDGIIVTVAGGGSFRSDPVVVNTKINPRSVAADARGNLYIAETGNLVRIVSARGITRVAVGQYNDTTFGNVGSPPGFMGDGGPALEALLNDPMSLAVDAQGNLFIADSRNDRVRRVTPVPTPATPAGLDAFSEYTSTLVGSFTRHVAIADVTGDGRDDALLTTTTWALGDEPQNDFKLILFVQQPDGTLAAPKRYPYFGDPIGGRSGTGLVTGDLNKDGFMDVVVGTLRGITVYLGNPSGLSNGVEHEAVPNAEATLQLAMMDVNRDGHLDVVALSAGRTEGGTSPTDLAGMVIYHGNGFGGFSGRSFKPRADDMGMKYLRAIDVNGDGIPDLTSTWTGAINGSRSGGLEVALHDGVAGFLSTQRLRVSTEAWWGAAYAIGDFNSDGTRDAIVSLDGNAPYAAYALFNQGPGRQFSERRVWSAFDSPGDMIGADMNGDGRDDLLVVHGGWSSVGLHLQTAEGLGEEIKYYIRHSGNPSFPSIAVGDLNSDGCKDVAVADYNHGLIVLRGKNCLITHRGLGSQPLIPSGQVSPVAVLRSVSGNSTEVQQIFQNAVEDDALTSTRVGVPQVTSVSRALAEWIWKHRVVLLLILVSMGASGLILRARLR